MTPFSNTQQGYVQLWQDLEHARSLCIMRHQRFCVHNVLKLWQGAFGLHRKGFDDLAWEIVNEMNQQGVEIYGRDELPPPQLKPRPAREFIRAFVMHSLGTNHRSINLEALDGAYSEVFPHSTPINVSKKKKKPPPVFCHIPKN